MGRHDDISPDRLRADLRRFAQLIRRLEDEGRLLDATPRIMKMMGDLRSKLFAYEVRSTGRLAPSDPEAGSDEASDSSQIREAERIVDDAIRRARKAGEEWSTPGDWDPHEGS